MPSCGTGFPPCTTIPGDTVSSFYWSSSTRSPGPDLAWFVHFNGGLVNYGFKDFAFYVRAVRGGS